MYKTEQIGKQMNENPIYDPLTGIANNFYFFQKFDDFLEKSRVNNKKGAFIYFDIDNFKVINDSLGHTIGDLALKLFSQLINYTIKNNCFFARLNGDEFGILVYDFKDIREIEEICLKIQNELKKPFNVMNNEIYFTVSMGISIFPDNSTDVDVLIRFCDFAMYKSKRKGKNTYTFFKNEIADIFYREAQIKNELENAIEREELYVFYQPQIDTVIDKIIGMEALLRWNNRELGIVSPAEFIPIAEKTGHIVRIGNWVLDEVLKQVSIWIKKEYEFKTVSINVSPIQIKRRDFKKNIVELCLKYKIPHDLIELEITEGTLIEIYNEKLKKLDELIGEGFKIAIDDFGTGYSSLSYLINIPVTTVKIDKIFIDNIENYKNKALVKSIVDLSQIFKYKVISEGVETKEQMKEVSNLGCNIIQGYYYSKPLSNKDFEEYLIKEGVIK